MLVGDGQRQAGEASGQAGVGCHAAVERRVDDRRPVAAQGGGQGKHRPAVIGAPEAPSTWTGTPKVFATATEAPAARAHTRTGR